MSRNEIFKNKKLIKRHLAFMMVRFMMVVCVLCLTSPAFAQEDSIFHEGNFRHYLSNMPPSYDGTKPVPLLLGFHGGGTNAQFFSLRSGLNAKSN